MFDTKSLPKRLSSHLREFDRIYSHLSKEEQDDWLENFLVEYTHDSTEIEGNTLTLIQTKMILIDKIVPAETRLRELDEVRGHADAWLYVRNEARNKLPISEDIIKNIHEKVVPMKGVGGIYRNIPVYIRGSKHVPPNPRKVWDLMGNFVYQANNDTFSNFIEKAAWIHAEFVKIHPFQDGNGRTARLLMNYSLLRDGIPPTSIKKGNIEKYFSTLEEYAINGNLKPFEKLLEENLFNEINSFLKMHENINCSKNHEELFYESHSGDNIQNESIREVWQKYLPQVAGIVMKIATDRSREEAFIHEMRKRLREKGYPDADVNQALREGIDGNSWSDGAPPLPPR